MNFRLLKRTSWVLAGALVLVACSSSSKSASTSPTTSSSSQQSTAPSAPSATSAAPTATGAAIVIGGVCSCTSPLGNTSDSFEPYKAWVNTVNAAGGINGHPVKFTFIDDKNNPALSVAAVHTLIQNDHAIAIVDASGLDQGWAPYVESVNVPVVGSGTSSNTFFTSPDFYPEGQTMDSVIFSQVAVGKAAGSNSVGVMYCAEAPTCLAAVTPFKQAGQKLGVAVPVSLKISAASPSYTAQCVASQQAGANGMSVLQEFSVVDKVITDCTKQGYHPVWIADGLDLAPSWTRHPRWSLRERDECSLLCELAVDNHDERSVRQVLPEHEDERELQRDLSLLVGFRSAVCGRGQSGRARCERQHADLGPTGQGTDVSQG